MPSQLLTARFCQGASPPEKGQIEYFDTKVPGFALCVINKGVKSWVFLYRHHGKVRRWTIGRYPDLSLADAREEARDARRAVAHGADPAGDKQRHRHAPTVSEIADEYLTRYAKVHKRSWRYDEQGLQGDVLPRWGSLSAASITRRDVIELLDAIVARGAPVQANRILQLIRQVLNWAISRDLLDYNPTFMVSPPSKEQARDRVLTEEEIRQVWRACEQTRARSAAILQLQLLTANGPTGRGGAGHALGRAGRRMVDDTGKRDQEQAGRTVCTFASRLWRSSATCVHPLEAFLTSSLVRPTPASLSVVWKPSQSGYESSPAWTSVKIRLPGFAAKPCKRQHDLRILGHGGFL